MAYINKLIKQGIASGISICDVSAATQIAMSEENLNKLSKILTKLIDVNLPNNSFSLYPTSRSGMKYKCSEGKVFGDIYNPGEISMEPNEMYYKRENKHDCACNDTAENITALMSDLGEMQDKVIAKMEVYKNTEIIDEFPMQPKMRKLLQHVRDELLTGVVKFDTLTQFDKALSYIRDRQRSKYLLSIIDPFTHRNVKKPVS